MSQNIAEEIKKLEALIATTSDDNVRKIFQKKLDDIKAKKTVTIDKDFSSLIQAINGLIDKAYSSGTTYSNQDIDKLIKERLQSFKIQEANLSPELKKLIGQTTKVIVEINQVKTSEQASDEQRLMDVLLSDVEAQNNVYLYGPAGTGKSYTAGKLADKINYKLIELNCNQFTSPLDIVGGQTIEGYQEGRLTQAWGNIDLGVNDKGEPYNGAVLLLDELPKLDPNTAGVLNAALAKIKDPVKRVKLPNGQEVKVYPKITNGRGEVIERKNIFVIATGNSLLNEANKDYEANFKQDLSLQDRFVGSTYLINYNYKFEYEKIMTNIVIGREGKPSIKVNLAFAFNFLALLRNEILKNNLTGVAFVSTRLMIVARDTFCSYIVNREEAPDNIKKPKTLFEVFQTFMSLFPIQQRQDLEKALATEIEDFKKRAEQKQNADLDDLNDETEQEAAVAKLIIEEAQKRYKSQSAIDL